MEEKKKRGMGEGCTRHLTSCKNSENNREVVEGGAPHTSPEKQGDATTTIRHHHYTTAKGGECITITTMKVERLVSIFILC